jgi:Zn-dependent peptidase ImmA (M78 family)
LTPKYNKDYIFWQTLFHELGHLVLYENEMVFCDADEEDEKKSFIEVEADTLCLINYCIHFHRDLEGYIDLKVIRRSKIDGWKEICKKARELNISPSLLTGTLKKMKLIPYNYYTDRHQNIFD